MSQLAEMYVTFSVSGAAEAEKLIGGVKKSFGEAEEAAKKADKATNYVGKIFEAALKTVERIGTTAKTAFAIATGSLTGFITAGLAGTVEGERLAQAMTALSREIASIFLPVIEKLTYGIERVAAWFRSLTGEQQNSIAKWAIIGIGALAFVGIMAKVVIAIVAVTKAVLLLTAASGPIGIILALISAVALILVGIFAGKKLGLDKLISDITAGPGTHRGLTVGTPQYEDPLQSRQRLQVAALKSDTGFQSLQEKQTDLLGKIMDFTGQTVVNTAATVGAIGGLKPGVSRAGGAGGAPAAGGQRVIGNGFGSDTI